MSEWQPVEGAPPWKAFQVQHVDDLYPVTAYRDDAGIWRYETDGPEDEEIGDHRHNPLRHQPTHYRDLPAPPEDTP